MLNGGQEQAAKALAAPEAGSGRASHRPTESTPEAGSWRRSASLMSAATVLISAANYGYTLAIIRLLRPSQFSGFAAGQSILLVLGNGAMAAVPWAVARYIAVEDRPLARSEALRVGLQASAVQAVGAAIVAMVIIGRVSSVAVASVTALGAALMSFSAAPAGYLQGTDRVSQLARYRILEGMVRVCSGLLAVLVISRTAPAALVGFAVGGAIFLVVALRACRDGLPLHKPDRAATRRLIHASLQLGSVQLLMVMLAALDTVAADAADFSTNVTASYQAAALLGRIPLFISTAVSLAVYTELTRARDDQAVANHVHQLLWFYSVLTVPVVLAWCTVPHSILTLFIPDTYRSAATLLRYTSISGAAIGLINCLTTAHQARGRFRSSIAILAPAAVLQPILLITLGRHFGVTAFAIGLVALSLTTLAAISFDARRWLHRPMRHPDRSLKSALLWTVMFAAGLAAGWLRSPVLWTLAIAVLTVSLGLIAKRSGSLHAA